MKMKMKIKVTQDIIDAALFMREQSGINWMTYLYASERCPIALALKMAGFPDAQAAGGAIYPYGPGCDKKQIVPPPAVDWFIYDFDAKREVAPFEFELDI